MRAAAAGTLVKAKLKQTLAPAFERTTDDGF